MGETQKKSYRKVGRNHSCVTVSRGFPSSSRMLFLRLCQWMFAAVARRKWRTQNQTVAVWRCPLASWKLYTELWCYTEMHESFIWNTRDTRDAAPTDVAHAHHQPSAVKWNHSPITILYPKALALAQPKLSHESSRFLNLRVECSQLHGIFGNFRTRSKAKIHV